MQRVTLYPLFHIKQECIGFKFENDKLIEECIRKVKGVRWSRTHICWYILYTPGNEETILHSLPPAIEINLTALANYHKKRAQISSIKIISGEKDELSGSTIKLTRISEQNLTALTQLTETLHLKAYSNSTIKTYKNEFCALLQLLKARDVSTLTADDIKRYILYCHSLKLSENTIHSRLNALKFYFEQVLKKRKNICRNTQTQKTFSTAKSTWRTGNR